MREIKLNIKSFRNKKKLSQEDLGRLVGVTKNTIINWEKDDSKVPFGKLLLLRTIFGEEFENLFIKENIGSRELEINNKGDYSGNSQSFAGGAEDSQTGDSTMQGNFIGEPKEYHFHNQLNEKLYEDLTQQYKKNIQILEQLVEEKVKRINELETKLKINN
jgi:transcriptional regulator with XRE-family HTH domain